MLCHALLPVVPYRVNASDMQFSFHNCCTHDEDDEFTPESFLLFNVLAAAMVMVDWESCR